MNEREVYYYKSTTEIIMRVRRGKGSGAASGWRDGILSGIYGWTRFYPLMVVEDGGQGMLTQYVQRPG